MKNVIKKCHYTYKLQLHLQYISEKNLQNRLYFSTNEKINKNSFIIQSYTLKIKKSMEAQLKIRQGPEKWGM